MKFPLRTTGTLGPVSGAAPHVWYAASGGPITVVAPADGLVAPISRGGDDSWGIVFYPGTTFVASHRVFNGWQAAIPNAFLFECSGLSGRDRLLQLASGRRQVVVFRRSGGRTEREPLFTAASEAVRARQAREFVDAHWWEAAGGRAQATAVDFMLQVHAGETLIEVAEPVGFSVVHAVDHVALTAPSAGHELFMFDTEEYLHRLADGGGIENIDRTPLRPREEEARRIAFARSFAINMNTGGLPPYLTLAGGLQRVSMSIPSGSTEIPQNILMLAPFETSDSSRDEIVLRADLPSGPPVPWRIRTDDGPTHSLRTNAYLDLTWGDLRPAAGILPFVRELVGGDATISLSAVKNPVAEIDRRLNALDDLMAHQINTLSLPVPDHTRTTYGHVEALRRVITALTEVESDPAAIASTIRALVVERPRNPDLDTVNDERRRISSELRALFESGWLINFCEIAGPDADEVLIRLPMTLRAFPEGRTAFQALLPGITPAFLGSRVANGSSGLRAAITLFSELALTAPTTASAGRYSVESLRRLVDSYLPGVVTIGRGQATWRVFPTEFEGGTVEVSVTPSVAIRDATVILRGIEMLLHWYNFFDSLSSTLNSDHRTFSDVLVPTSSLGARALGSTIEFYLALRFGRGPAATLQEATLSSVVDIAVGRGAGIRHLEGSEIRLLRLFGARLGVAALAVFVCVLDIVEFGPRAHRHWHRGEHASAAFVGLAIFGSVLGAVGTVVGLAAPPIGAMLVLAGAILSIIGFVGMETFRESHERNDWHWQELLWTLRHSYFGRDYDAAGNSLRDDIPHQIAHIYGFFFRLEGECLLNGDSLYIRLDASSFRIPPQARILLTLRDAEGNPVRAIAFTIDIADRSVRVLAEHGDVAIDGTNLDSETILLRLRGEVPTGPTVVEVTRSLEALITLASYGPPPDYGPEFRRVWEAMYGNAEAYSTRARFLRNEASSLPARYDRLVRAF